MFHTLIIAGNVGRDAEQRFTPSGDPVTSFSVASNRQYTNKAGEAVKETIWFRVTTWGKQAEVCNKYVKKGMKVLVEGMLQPDKKTGCPRAWKRDDGEPASSYEVTASTVRFLSRATDEPAQPELPQADDNDLPF